MNGLIQIYYGNGKGKTSAAIGSIIRAINYKYKVCLIKFFKIENISGEDRILKSLNIEIHFSKYKHPFFYYNSVDNKLKKKIFDYQKYLLNVAKEKLTGKYDLIVLDEILDLIKEEIISTKDLLDIIKGKNKNTELILTGHYINEKLIKFADLVTEIKKIKHYFDKGISNRKGYDY